MEQVGCSWEHAGEHIGNLQNMLRTWWEHIENRKKIKKFQHPLPSQKEKNWVLLGAWYNSPLVEYNF